MATPTIFRINPRTVTAKMPTTVLVESRVIAVKMYVIDAKRRKRLIVQSQSKIYMNCCRKNVGAADKRTAAGKELEGGS